MKYACLVLAASVSYLHDVVCECNETLDAVEDGDVSYEELQKRFHAVTNSVHGVYALLCNRRTMLELRGQLEQEPGSSQRGSAEALRAKLQFVEDRVYQAANGVVADEVLQQWLNDFDKNRGKAVLSATSKNVASADTRVVKYHRDRDQRWKERKRYYEEKDAQQPSPCAGRGKLTVQQRRNEKKGQWEPVQVVEHLGLEVDLKLGKFRVTERRVHKIHTIAKEILSPTRAKVHTDSSMVAWGGVPNLKFPARGFWPDEMRNWHITHLELEAVYKTVQAFLKELEGKVSSSATSTTPKVTVGTRLEIFWADDDKFYPGVVNSFNKDGTTHVVYDDGDEETLDLSKENFKIIDSPGVSELTDETADANGEGIDRGGDYA
eukprot:gene34069-biopygen9771